MTKQLDYDAFQVLGKLSSAGKVVSAWVLPSGNPTRDLNLSGANVSSWSAACGTHPIDLVGAVSPPQWDDALFDNKGALTFDGVSQCLAGNAAPVGWPSATEDLYLLAAVRQDFLDSESNQGTALSYGDGPSLWRALQRNGNSGASLLRLKVGTSVADSSSALNGIHTIGGAVDMAGTSTVYLDGAAEGSVATASGSLVLTRVRLGASANTVAQLFWKGAIASAVVLNSTATLQDFLDLEAEFRARIA